MDGYFMQAQGKLTHPIRYSYLRSILLLGQSRRVTTRGATAAAAEILAAHTNEETMSEDRTCYRRSVR